MKNRLKMKILKAENEQLSVNIEHATSQQKMLHNHFKEALNFLDTVDYKSLKEKELFNNFIIAKFIKASDLIISTLK